MHNKLVKSSLILVVITLISKMLGLIREVVMANYLGTSEVSDAYILGTTLSQIVVTGLAGAFFKTYIPIATEEKSKSNQHFVDFTIQLLLVGTGLFTVISGVIYATARYTTYWLSAGASDNVINLAIGVCKATAFPSAFLLAVNILQGYLHTKEKFLSNTIYPFVMNVTIILGIIIGKGDITYLSIAYGASILLSSVALWIYCRMNKFTSFSIKGVLTNQAIKKSIYLTMPLFWGGIVSEINEIIDRYFSTFYTAGVLSALRYGKLLEIFIVSAIGIAIGQAAYPQISLLICEKKVKKLESLISTIFKFFLFLIIPVFVGIIILGKDIVAVLFMRGAFDSTSVNNTSIAFIIYSISILPVSVNEIICRVFIAYNDTKHPVVYSILSMGANIVLNTAVVYVLKMEFYGLAMTTSVCETLLAVLYLFGMRKILNIKIKIDCKVIVQELVSALIMGGVLLITGNIIIDNSLIRIGVMTCEGFFTYIAMMYILNKSLLSDVLNQIRRK